MSFLAHFRWQDLIDILLNSYILFRLYVLFRGTYVFRVLTGIAFLWIFLIIIVVVGGAAIANYMYSNVFQRRREIGTLMALGAESGVVLRIFLLKGFLLGLVGGVGGFAIGTILAITLGPKFAGVPVFPMPTLAFWAVGISLAITLAASYFPARSAVRLDPVATFQEL